MDQQTRQVIKLTVALVCFILALAGVVGLAYKIFRPEGWLVQAVSRVWDLQINFSIMTIPVLIGVFLLGKALFSDLLEKKSKFGNFMTYAFMALGLYFIVRVLFFDGV